ncbi:NAD(P)/FAD-dependent oxidoreductase [Nocardia sp. CDC159]|uniref:NAD(P)/FAD-dependent oxidoreductase n=1 Tax=Nocardia pulmonis TaxID=2951408 RepID=A0A9X2IX61_9NOCA|nr:MULTISPECIES: NAD(P)/FAD-dependent oxidoreductase [Nocardia]MCM6772586.1 NAD(P)/FAD-dependent oxidoreductase [Nocardia pulmonis]MCM6784756.1 NAD(P)/FAD-dependent oxidoreductase [Nocardia sp. CDC159]
MSIAVIGAGFSGLGMAIRLKRAGFSDLVIFEKDRDLGGTWLQNHYPGCAADIPSVLYSLSAYEKRDWSRIYATQPEILAYQHELARRFDLERHFRFDTEIVDFTFDETTARWRLTAADGRRFEADLVFGGFGPLHQPRIPALPGRDLFSGTQLHSRQWDDDFDPTGKRIAVVGTGSSAVEIVPALAERAAQLYVFQRSAPYIMPKTADVAVTGTLRLALKYLPGFYRLLRFLVVAVTHMAHLAQKYDFFCRLMERQAAALRNKEITDPHLREMVTPTYRFGCKRTPNTNEYLPALTRPDVEVIPSALARLTAHTAIAADGTEREVDAVVWSTGFAVGDAFRRLPITGRDGITLADTCGPQGVETYMGLCVSGFPNLFFILGPYGQTTHTSLLLNIDFQTRYLTTIARAFRDHDLRTIEVRREAQRRFLERAWSITSLGFMSRGGSCANYLQDPVTGRVLAWPGSVTDMWLRLRRVRFEDYRITYAEGSQIPSGSPGIAVVPEPIGD